MLRDINQEIEKLLEIKKEVDKINELRKINKNLMVVSQARYNYISSANPVDQDIYYIAPLEVRPYVEGYQG